MNKDIVIFVNAIRPMTFKALRNYEETSGRHFTPIVLVDSTIKDSIFERNGQYNLPEKVTVITADFTSARSVREALKPLKGRIFAVTSQYENCIQELRMLLPYLPYLPGPTEKSLLWSTEKKLMRKMLEAYDPSLVPGYIDAKDASLETIEDIEANLSYPLIVKPSGLEGSLLVSMVQNRDELYATLKHTFNEVQTGYDTWIKRQTPVILVEEFMEGDMYSIDTYISHNGTVHHTPLVHVVTGRKVGFDDFFGYAHLTPAALENQDLDDAYSAAEKACHALGLRSVTAHIELMKTPTGWKIIELGPRIGGYRHDLYQRSYGINHIVNDILIRGGDQPQLPRNILKHTTVLKIYARSEGNLHKVDGLEMLEKLPAYISHRQIINPGEPAKFAKNNGDAILEVFLSHEDKSQLHADIAHVEDKIKVHVD